MPLILRHFAAAVLPLSATAAGILAVGIAVELPRGPSPFVAAPPVVSPLEPSPGSSPTSRRGRRERLLS